MSPNEFKKVFIAFHKDKYGLNVPDINPDYVDAVKDALTRKDMSGQILFEGVNGKNVLHDSALIDRLAYMYSADDLIDLVNDHQSVSLFRVNVPSHDGRAVSYAPQTIRHNIEPLQPAGHNDISSKIDPLPVVSANCQETEKECIVGHSVKRSVHRLSL